MKNKRCRRVATDTTIPLFDALLSATPIHSTSTSCELLEAYVSSDSNIRSSSLFSVPPEIRLSIYHAILIENNDSAAILQTCSQINMEAREVLYQRAPTFDSQAKLFAWIAKSSARNLNRVRTITLRLTDVDLNSLLEEPGPKRRTRSTLWSLYIRDRHRLEQSLSALSNLSRLTIIPPQIGHSALLKNLYHSFLAEIPKRCPRLKQLEICDSDSLLDAVPELKRIRRFIFTEQIADATIKAESNLKEPREFDATESGRVNIKRSPLPDSRSVRQAAHPKTTLNR